MSYFQTFIQTAEDCPAQVGVIPITKDGKTKTIHAIQYEIINNNPYKLTQEDVLFHVFAIRNGIKITDSNARSVFLNKKHPCLRTSALGKKYGWGIHFDKDGMINLYPRESEQHQKLSNNLIIKQIKAMRNKRAQE